MNKYARIGYWVIGAATLVTVLDMFLSLNVDYHFDLKFEYVLIGLLSGLAMVILPFELMENVFTDLYNSFNNKKDKGFSARKLTAFAFVNLAAWIHYQHINHDNAIEALMIDGAIVLICLGIITAGNIIEFKNGTKQPTDKEDRPNEDSI
jgi:hypothetical protein